MRYFWTWFRSQYYVPNKPKKWRNILMPASCKEFWNVTFWTHRHQKLLLLLQSFKNVVCGISSHSLSLSQTTHTRDIQKTFCNVLGVQKSTYYECLLKRTIQRQKLTTHKIVKRWTAATEEKNIVVSKNVNWTDSKIHMEEVETFLRDYIWWDRVTWIATRVTKGVKIKRWLLKLCF